MKPRLGVVFPQITDEEICNLKVEKISVSKNRRKVKILLGSDTSAYQSAKVESAVKKACNLTEVIVKVDENTGLITAVGIGNARIYAKANDDSSLVEFCAVSVDAHKFGE